jgi:hypothetical protein
MHSLFPCLLRERFRLRDSAFKRLLARQDVLPGPTSVFNWRRFRLCRVVLGRMPAVSSPRVTSAPQMNEPRAMARGFSIGPGGPSRGYQRPS